MKAEPFSQLPDRLTGLVVDNEFDTLSRCWSASAARHRTPWFAGPIWQFQQRRIRFPWSAWFE
jgi:hypothetical protein